MKTTLCIACVLLLGAAAAWGIRPEQEAPQSRGFAGSAACRDCHEDLFARYEANVHSRAAEQRRLDAAAPGCESCHGPGKKHADDPSDKSELVTFATGQEERSNAACLTCYRIDEQVGGFSRSEHGRQSVSCNECHRSPHSEVSVLPMRTAFFNERPPPQEIATLREEESGHDYPETDNFNHCSSFRSHLFPGQSEGAE